VKILRVRAEGFGPLRELDTGEEESLPGLVAVVGPNEAGKSSFRQAVVTLLYGFQPATRDTNPLAPWSGETPELRAWIETTGGETLEVHRRLLSRPDGAVTRGSHAERIRNHPLPELAHVARGVYEQVYALTLAELAGLEGEGWGAVQDRLVVGMGSSDLRSPREAAADLEGRAAALWRPDRRGRPRFAELRAELERLREARREAMDRDRELRALHRRLEEGDASMARLRARREALEEERSRVARLQPLARRLRHLDELAATVGEARELAGLPADPESALADLDERLDAAASRRRRLVAALEDAGQRADAVDGKTKALVERRSELRALADRAPVLQERAASRGRLDAELDELDRRVRSAAGHLVEGEPPEAETLSALSFARLRAALDRLEGSRRSLEAVGDAREQAERRDGPGEPPPFPGGAGAAFLAGSLLLVIGFLPGVAEGDLRGWVALLVLAGALSAAWGGIGIARWKARRELEAEKGKAREREARALEDRIRALEEERERHRREVLELLDPLPLRREIRERPEPALAGELERLRDVLLDRAGRLRVRDELRAEDRATAEALERVREQVAALHDLPTDPVAALPELARRLDEGGRRMDAAASAARERDRVALELEEAERERAGLEARRSELEGGIRGAGGGAESTQAALAAVLRRLRAREALDRGWDELRRERGSLEGERAELERAEAEGASWLRDPDAPARLDRRLRELAVETEDLRGELERTRERARTIEKEETVDLVDGRILAVEEEIARVRRERDRLFVLARLVRVAERRFREAHQPDLLKRAGRHLARITGGRYERLLLADGAGAAPFLLDAAHLPGPSPVAPPLSTGTREQTWLALRLAIVDHLDRDREPLPLFLDEVLVNWDEERRARGLDLLADSAGTRQVFLFTCHPTLAEGVEARGGRVIELAAPRPVG
jgi:uncharacterized protein YhaN